MKYFRLTKDKKIAPHRYHQFRKPLFQLRYSQTPPQMAFDFGDAKVDLLVYACLNALKV